jgi:TRAP-type C4-dicarboxylate transport system permease small subunit
MYHMLVDYFLRMLSPTILRWKLFSNVQFAVLYQISLILFTILVSAFSYRYFERFFLQIKSRYGVTMKSAG